MGRLKTSVIVFPVLWQLRDLRAGLFTLSFSWLILHLHPVRGLVIRKVVLLGGTQVSSSLSLGQPGTRLMAGPRLRVTQHMCMRAFALRKITV